MCVLEFEPPSDFLCCAKVIKYCWWGRVKEKLHRDFAFNHFALVKSVLAASTMYWYCPLDSILRCAKNLSRILCPLNFSAFNRSMNCIHSAAADTLGQRYFLGTSTVQKWLKPFHDGFLFIARGLNRGLWVDVEIVNHFNGLTTFHN